MGISRRRRGNRSVLCALTGSTRLQWAAPNVTIANLDTIATRAMPIIRRSFARHVRWHSIPRRPSSLNARSVRSEGSTTGTMHHHAPCAVLVGIRTRHGQRRACLVLCPIIRTHRNRLCARLVGLDISPDLQVHHLLIQAHQGPALPPAGR